MYNLFPNISGALTNISITNASTNKEYIARFQPMFQFVNANEDITKYNKVNKTQILLNSYYFLNEEVKTLVKNMANAFPNSVLVFDGANRTAVKMIAKTWLKTAKIKDVGAYFAVSNAKAELSPWDENIEVSSRGYMLGYQDLKDASVNGFFRFLAKLGDNALKMQIVKITFKGK